ncbi:MAG: amino acid--tRNA ligase-related protein, partial [Oscillospiraceae bacterium]
VVADAKNDVVFAALGALRCECARRMDIIDPNDFKLLWVTDFPLLEYDEEAGRYAAKHHPFTAPRDEDIELLETCPEKVYAKAYDIVINGSEAGGGSSRIHESDLQEKMFKALGFTHERAQAQFGHLIEAFSYGAPPHGGLAYGLDRLVMLLGGRESIRDVIAFPKVQNAAELMMASPDVVDEAQLHELHIALETE